MTYDYVQEKIYSITQIKTQTRTNVARRIWELQQQAKSALDAGEISQEDYDRIIVTSDGEVTRIY
jgi:hypothetical protein